MRKLHIYTLNPDSSYGGEFRVNNLAFYTNTDEKLEVTEIVHVNNNEATFKVNGVNGRINVPLAYGSYYYPSNIFSTEMSENYSLMVRNNIGAAHEQKGFWVYFDEDVKFSYLTLAYHYTSPRDFVVQLDDKPVTEPVNADRGTVFKINMPKSRFRCFVGKDGLHYFLRPDYNKADTTPSADPNDVPNANVI